MTKSIEERLNDLESTQYEMMENVNGALTSIKFAISKIKEDHYEKQENPDELDGAIEELNDSINWIQELMDSDEE